MQIAAVWYSIHQTLLNSTVSGPDVKWWDGTWQLSYVRCLCLCCLWSNSLFDSLQSIFTDLLSLSEDIWGPNTHTQSVQPGGCVLISPTGWQRWRPPSISQCVADGGQCNFTLINTTVPQPRRPNMLIKYRHHVTKKHTHTHTRSVLSGKVSWWMTLWGRRPLEPIIPRHWSDRLAASDGESEPVTDLSRLKLAHLVAEF